MAGSFRQSCLTGPRGRTMPHLIMLFFFMIIASMVGCVLM